MTSYLKIRFETFQKMARRKALAKRKPERSCLVVVLRDRIIAQDDLHLVFAKVKVNLSSCDLIDFFGIHSSF